MKKLKITYVVLKQAITVPGALGAVLSLDTNNEKGLDMEREEGGTVIKCSYKNKYFDIPLCNIKDYVYTYVDVVPNPTSVPKSKQN